MKPLYKPSIFLAIPNLGVIDTDISVLLLQWFFSGKYRLKYFPPKNVRPLDKARNVCHQEFLKEDYDYLFFLDARVVPPFDVIDRLLKADKDMISATVQTIQSHEGEPRLIPVALRMDEKDKGYKPYFGKGIEEVDVTTCACTLLKRKVMEEVGKQAFKHTMTDEEGVEGLSEDFYFSERVKRAGFRIWNDYTMLCSHFKDTDMRVINQLMQLAFKEGQGS